MGIKTVTVTRVTDDLTGADVPESDVFKVPFTFQEVTGNVYLTADSLAKINALPEIAALVKAASENGTDTNARTGTSGPSNAIVAGTTVRQIDMRKWAIETGFAKTNGEQFGKTGKIKPSELTPLTAAYLAANPDKRADTTDANTDASAPKTASKASAK